MSAVIMDGKTLAQKVREKVKARAAVLKEKGIIPCLAVVLVGEDPASLSYVKSKEKALAEAGMESRDIRLPADTTQDALLSIIDELNKDEKIHGILVQSPVPKHIDEDTITSAITPEKDVDCFHPFSVGSMILEKVLMFLREYNIPVSGAHVVIVGRSNIVGKPLANLLVRREYNATVTICHTGTKNLKSFTKQADILVAAAGRPGIIKPDMIKKGAVVIDVGINRVPDPSAKKGYRVCGDVDPYVDPSVVKKSAFFTPVPGGVGLMTVAMLLQNVVEAAAKQNSVSFV